MIDFFSHGPDARSAARLVVLWCLAIVSGCAAMVDDGASLRVDDIVRIPLSPAVAGRTTLTHLPPARPGDAAILRREERLRRDLDLHHAPDGYHYGCYRRDIDPGC